MKFRRKMAEFFLEVNVIYRTYLRTTAGVTSEKTATRDPEIAFAAFAALVDRSDLDGRNLAAALTGDNSQIAYHRFYGQPGGENYWRGRFHDIDWPEGRPAGRPPELTGGVRVNVYLDAESLEVARRLGNGNASAGIRAALAQAISLLRLQD